MATRYTKENQHLIMEEVALDLAEAIRFLKQERGFTHVVLHGHSGGGSTVSFYQQQATLVPPNRVKSTPAGDPPDLNQFDLPKADGLIISAAHVGRGWAVARKLDPSILDEEDPLSTDYSLDPFNPENGYRPPPEWSHYSKEFLERFQVAQAGRMARLTQQAYNMVAERRMYQKALEAPDFKQRPLHERLKIERGAIVQRYITIYRTYANLMYNDPSVASNDREPGAAGSTRTDHYNYYRWYHPRLITPEALLSSECLESNVYSPRVLPDVTVPVLVILGTADPDARHAESKAAFDAAGTKDKEFILVEGADHGYLPAGPKAGDGKQRDQVIRTFSDWLTKRFPSSQTTSSP
jgi:alpha-beta hydrolase superfamily lysophospholipase